jgi:tetratricopeptide (TPR) repeat protein
MRKMKWARWPNGKGLASADENLEAALTEIDTQLRYWGEKHSNYNRQRATAYLLRGAICAANGTKKRANGKDASEHNRIALDFFEKALEIDPNDHHALEYTAHQQRILGMVEEALGTYKQLEGVANRPEPEFILVRMRALRFLGELYERRYDTTNVKARLQDAQDALREALKIVPAVARDDLDHAFIHRALASVEWKKGSQLWQNHISAAERMFLELIRRKRSTKEAEAGLADVRKLGEEIDAQAAAATATSVANGDPQPTATSP